MFKLIKFIIGLILFLVLAVIIFAVVIIVLNRGNKPKSKTTSPSYSLGELNTLTVNVDVKDSYVVVKKSKDGKVNFNYYASQTRTFEETTETDLLGNVTLSLKGYQTGKWYNRLFLTFKTTKVYGVTIEVPDDCNVNVKTNNGNIRFEEVYLSTATADTTNGAAIFKKSNASICSLNTVNGNVEASSSNVGTFYCRARKGKVNLDNLVSLIDIDASTDDGNIILTNSYATGNFKLHSGKGDITGSIRLLSDAYYKITTKAFNGTTNQQNTSTGIAELLVTTDNGNISLELKKVIA